jgi:heme-degrading monooxygenase HmoA
MAGGGARKEREDAPIVPNWQPVPEDCDLDLRLNRSVVARAMPHLTGAPGPLCRRQPRSLALIRHIVFFTAKHAANLDAIEEGLALLGQIPHSRHFEVTRNLKVDQIGNDVDVVVYAEFDDEAALAAYKAHPLYAEATKRVRPLRELRYAADFKAREAVKLRRSA